MVATLVAVLILIIALFLVFKRIGGNRYSSQITQTYYFVLDSGELVAAPAQQISPIATEDGRTAVEAMVLTCGSCSESDRFVAYLAKYSDETKARLEQYNAELEQLDPENEEHQEMLSRMQRDYEEGLLVASAEQPTRWVKMNSPQGTEIINYRADCGDKRIKPCYPSQ